MTTATINRYEQIAKPTNWKDKAAGWAKWKVFIDKCNRCHKKDTYYTVSGSEADVKELAANPEMNDCDKCC